MKFLIKDERRFYNWENGKVTLPMDGSNRTLDLNRFEILKPLCFDIVDCLGSRFNTAKATYCKVFYNFILLEKLLYVAGIKITSANDLDVTVFTSIFAILRDNS